MFAKLEVLHTDASASVGTLGSCVVSVWRRDLPLSCVFQVSRALKDLHAALPGQKLALLSFVESECAVPASPEVAAAFGEMLKRFGDALVATAVVYDRGGFWAAGMRSQVMAINAESRAGIPHHVSSSLDESARWLSPFIVDQLPDSAAALIGAVSDLRKRRAPG